MWLVISKISSIKLLVRKHNNYLFYITVTTNYFYIFSADTLGKQICWALNCSNWCFISVDVTDLLIQEPTRPIDPRYFLHKINQAGIRYKVAAAFYIGWIVWTNRLFPAGKYSNLIIANSSMIHFLTLSSLI